MIEYLVLAIVLITFTLASIEDLKKREVYDYLNFSLVFIILIIAIFHSLIISSYDPIKYVSFGIIIGFGFGAFLFYFGIWGGGDSKFLLGFSGSIYYLINFVSPISNAGFVYQYFLSSLSNFFTFFLDTFLGYILVLDMIFMIFLLVKLIFSKNRYEVQDLLFLFVLLSLLFLGLYFDYDPLTLILIGLIAFVLIFMAKEDAFSLIYIKLKKDYLELKSGDKIESDIIYDDKKIVEIDESGYNTLSKEQVHDINEIVKESGHEIYIRKIIPYSILITLNYIVYLFKIITVEDLAKNNLFILSFLLKFLFYSFMSGGILAIILVIYLFIKNFHRVEFKFSNLEKIISFPGFLIIGFLVAFLGPKFSLLFLLYPLYFFIKIAKSIEHFAFIKKKPLDEIVLGDWIVQDIQVGKKIYYHLQDFKIGVDEFQLEKIKELAKNNKNLQKLLVKDGIAFLPALFLGFILMFII